MHGVDQRSKFRQSFTAEIHAVQIGLCVDILIDFRIGDLLDQGLRLWGNSTFAMSRRHPRSKTHVCGKVRLNERPTISEDGCGETFCGSLEL